MPQQQARPHDQKTIGQIEYRPFDQAEIDPIPHCVDRLSHLVEGVGVFPPQAGKSKPIVKVAQCARRDTSEREAQEPIACCPGTVHPVKNADDGQNAQRDEDAALTLSHAEEGTFVEARFQGERIGDDPVSVSARRTAEPAEDPLLGRQVGHQANNQGREEENRAGDERSLSDPDGWRSRCTRACRG